MLLILLLSTCLVSSQDDDWIDPTDMLNYDAASGKMRYQQQVYKEQPSRLERDKESLQTACIELKVVQEQKEVWEQTVENLKEQVSECKIKERAQSAHGNTSPIFRRYLYKIINEAAQVALPDESQPEIHYDAEVILTKQMLAEIQSFLKDADWTVGALDDALSKTLVKFKPHNVEEWRWKFEDYVGVDAHTLFMVLLCILCIVSLIATELWTRVGWVTQIKRLCLLSIVISFGWNWLYLYKVAFAERQAEVAKMEKFDSSCGEKMSWSENLLSIIKGSVTFQNDPCEEYFKTIMVNPALLVPPTKALALTFTDFVTEPLKHIGKGIGEFLKALLSEIPVLLQIPVLIFLAVALLGLCYGTGRSVGQINRIQYLSGPDGDRPRPVEQNRSEYNRFIDDVNRQRPPQDNYHQLVQREQGTAIEQRPETVRALDITDHTGYQEPSDYGHCYGTGTSVAQSNRIQCLPGPDGDRPQPVGENRTKDKESNDDVKRRRPPQVGFPHLQQRPETVRAMHVTDHTRHQERSDDVLAPVLPSKERDQSVRQQQGPWVQEQLPCKETLKRFCEDDAPPECRGAVSEPLRSELAATSLSPQKEEDSEDENKKLPRDCQSEKDSEDDQSKEHPAALIAHNPPTPVDTITSNVSADTETEHEVHQ
ncbi:chloride channel CLIC-like protein 1 [Discoglossus pictus]